MLCEGQAAFELVYAWSGLPPSHNVVIEINLLACGEKIGLYLLPTQALFVLGGRSDD